jgi:hypothetical protein
MRSVPLRRTYSDFRGVDFANDPSLVLLSRSPDALNVWKNYKDTQGSCIESRPGYKDIFNYGHDTINGIYFYNDKCIVHAKTYLIQWNNFPDRPNNTSPTTLLKSNMNNAKSSFCIFNEKLYIVDGANYLVYDGTTLKDVSSDNPYIPTTTISRSPSGGGEPYQDVNVLQPKRKNTFVADGTSTDYYLDTTEIDSITEVKVNDAVVTNYTVNTTAGKVTFSTAPAAPTLSGVDNVEITYSKSVAGYTDRISKCTKMVVFDRRLFFSGNPDYPNAVFHSNLNEPGYVSDLAYYQDGTDESAIKQLVVGNNILWVFKEPSQEKDTIFYHTATTDTYGRVYPNFQGNVSIGCISDAINYKDDIVFLSQMGLEGISSNDIASQQLVGHKSSLVDNKLINETNYDKASLVEWNGYIVILVNSHIYLGDIRQLWQSVNGYEYEWYYWDLGIQATILKEYKGNLYIGDSDSHIYILEGTNDGVIETHTSLFSGTNTNKIYLSGTPKGGLTPYYLDLYVGRFIRIGTSYLDSSIAEHREITNIVAATKNGVSCTEITFNGNAISFDAGVSVCREGGIINAHWTTPMDNFGNGNKYKTTNKRGGVAKIKAIPNAKIKVAERTNKSDVYKFIKEYPSAGFDFGDIDFDNFAFTTTATSNIVYKIKEKKFVELQLKFYTDELDKPFGVYGAIIETFEGGYVKR